MAEFKCIGCGATKESQKECSCPVCGYRMYESPYERRELLIGKITDFFEVTKVKTITRDDLAFKGKEKDDNRFPTFQKIREYVISERRTEDFIKNLNRSIEQIQIHYQTPFSNTYEVCFDNLVSSLRRQDRIFSEAYKAVLGTKPSFDEPQWPVSRLFYFENKNQYLLFSAEELLQSLGKLTDKINRFIRINNLYGFAQSYTPDDETDQKKDKSTDCKDQLEKEIDALDSIIKKKYDVDITDDGTEQLSEMMNALWHAIELLMSAPLFIKEYRYREGKVTDSEEDFLKALSDLVSRHYDFPEIYLCLSQKNEQELFSIYDRLIEIDEFGILGTNKSGLMKMGEFEKKLDSLIGLSSVKESIRKIKAYAEANKDSDEELNIHMCFYGNPGTGKTEVARIIAGILYENKILPTKNVVEVDRSGLVSEYFGATAEKTKGVIQKAMGGVLFIDEAYALGNNTGKFGTADYGKEAIDTLVKAMEDYRGKICVIFAGYKNEMLKMLSVNPGMRSRIQFELDFPNYSRDELREIAKLMLEKREYNMDGSALEKLLDVTDVKRKDPNFANAREIRNILDQTVMCQNLRRIDSDDHEIGVIDINRYIEDTGINLPLSAGGSDRTILTGEEELEELIGLDTVKRMIKKIRAYAKRNKGQDEFNLHMCFYGNPGTGKTEVARILSRILYDAGILPEAKLVETDSYGLMGKFVGETAPKTLNKINDAMNGVLFIDEAYGLVPQNKASIGASSFGEEAVTVLLKEMEDRRGKFCVIFAGYKEEMKKLLESNPGLASRIQFTLDFPDYNREELGEIASLFLKKKKYEMEDKAFERLLDVIEYYRSEPNFANARTVRSVLDQVIMNQNLRTEDNPNNNYLIEEDVMDYIEDEGIRFV